MRNSQPHNTKFLWTYIRNCITHINDSKENYIRFMTHCHFATLPSRWACEYGESIMDCTMLKDVGEKEIIRTIIKPLFNPDNRRDLAGDDSAIIDTSSVRHVCCSTDRVPSDLISFKLGIITYFELGYYLAVLNISDIIATGAQPIGLLVNLAFPGDFLLRDLKTLLHGVDTACKEYECEVLGGDLSSSVEMNISATSLGTINTASPLYRSGAMIGDYIYCSDFIGLTSTAFHYFLKARSLGLSLSESHETLLRNQFRRPRARLTVSHQLSLLSSQSMRVTCMDNTDGVGQTLLELSELNAQAFHLNTSLLPIHDVSFLVAFFLDIDVVDMVLAGGADFQLIGTIDSSLSSEDISARLSNNLKIIGETHGGDGVWLVDRNSRSRPYRAVGWDYFATESIFHG